MKLLLPLAAALTFAALNGCMTAKDRLIYEEITAQKQELKKKADETPAQQSSDKDTPKAPVANL